jgi:hypothetical protein
MARGVALTSALLVGVLLLALPGSAVAAGPCETNELRLNLSNKTNGPMTLVRAVHGVTNAWCRREPPKVVVAKSGQYVPVGDNVFGVEAVVTYRLHNGDEVTFTAQLGFLGFSGAAAGCEFTRVVDSSRPYVCTASADQVTHHGFADNPGGFDRYAEVFWDVKPKGS